MMGTREPMKGAAEYDHFTRWRRYLRKRAGRFTATKAHFWRRVRKAYRLRAREEEAE